MKVTAAESSSATMIRWRAKVKAVGGVTVGLEPGGIREWQDGETGSDALV